MRLDGDDSNERYIEVEVHISVYPRWQKGGNLEEEESMIFK